MPLRDGYVKGILGQIPGGPRQLVHELVALREDESFVDGRLYFPDCPFDVANGRLVVGRVLGQLFERRFELGDRIIRLVREGCTWIVSGD